MLVSVGNENALTVMKTVINAMDKGIEEEKTD